jgi:prepilin-type processing-associated H-X9-DG protein
MFAHESEDQVFPELSPEPGKLMFSNQNEAHPNPIYSEFISDLKIFACPEDGNVDWDATDDPTIMIDDQSYFYLGYAITNQTELQAFAEAYQKQITDGGNFKENLPVADATGTAGSPNLYRLHNDLRSKIAEDIGESAIDTNPPVLIERSGNHTEPAGGNVLYFDGHVEFIRHGNWPMTDEALAVLNNLDKLSAEPTH